MRKVKVLLIVGLLFFVTSCTVQIPTDNYDEHLSELSASILDLQAQNTALSAELEAANVRMAEIMSDIENHYDKDTLYNWFNKCNIYAVRSNVKIALTTSNSPFNLGDPVYSSGVIIASSGSTYYAIGSYFATKAVEKGMFTSYKIYDAFETSYSASLVSYDQNLGLALFRFTVNSGNELNVMKVRSSDLEEYDPVCTIFSLSNSTYNHMIYSTITDKASDTGYVDYDLYITKIDVISSIYGAMNVDVDGKLAGIVLLTKNSSYEAYFAPASIINQFLNNVFN